MIFLKGMTEKNFSEISVRDHLRNFWKIPWKLRSESLVHISAKYMR